MLAAADHAVETARRSARGEIGALTVGFFNGGTGADVPEIIKNFRRLHPDVRVSVADMVPGLQSKALVDGSMDVGFTRPLETPFDQLLRSELLYLDPLVAVLPKDHPLARGAVDLRESGAGAVRAGGARIVAIAVRKDSGAVLGGRFFAADREHRRGLGKRGAAGGSRAKVLRSCPAICSTERRRTWRSAR